MNTAELVRHLCDGKNSLNQIVDLLIQCGHVREVVIEEWIQLSSSGDYGMRFVRVPRTVRDEEIGLDEPVLFLLDNN